MRLIDADVAQHIANIELSSDDAGTVQWVLSHTPTVEAEPVRHGRWIEEYDEHWELWRLTCPYCNNDYTSISKYLENYCSKCGAKMDGE